NPKPPRARMPRRVRRHLHHDGVHQRRHCASHAQPQQLEWIVHRHWHRLWLGRHARRAHGRWRQWCALEPGHLDCHGGVWQTAVEESAVLWRGAVRGCVRGGTRRLLDVLPGAQRSGPLPDHQDRRRLCHLPRDVGKQRQCVCQRSGRHVAAGVYGLLRGRPRQHADESSHEAIDDRLGGHHAHHELQCVDGTAM
ncbi:unnamed protein product, partial [Aphanomyces euteiches]